MEIWNAELWLWNDSIVEHGIVKHVSEYYYYRVVVVIIVLLYKYVVPGIISRCKWIYFQDF